MMPMHVNNLACANGGGQEGRTTILFLMTVGGGGMSHSGEFKIGESMESLLEMVYTNWEFITKLCKFYPRKQVFLGF